MYFTVLVSKLPENDVVVETLHGFQLPCLVLESRSFFRLSLFIVAISLFPQRVIQVAYRAVCRPVPATVTKRSSAVESPAIDAMQTVVLKQSSALLRGKDADENCARSLRHRNELIVVASPSSRSTLSEFAASDSSSTFRAERPLGLQRRSTRDSPEPNANPVALQQVLQNVPDIWNRIRDVS